MDKLTLIVDALSTATALVAKQAVGEAVKDAYHSLKYKIQQKLAGNKDAEMILVKHEGKPATWKEPLKDFLAEAGADGDHELVQAAQNLMMLLNPQQAGKYNIQISGNVLSSAIGDGAHVSVSYSNTPEKK